VKITSSDQGVPRSSVHVEGLLGPAFGAADLDADADAGADVALVGEDRQAAGRGLVKSRQE
jgi:hypothetical protein